VRLLHTSDWHLGRTLHGHSLQHAQQDAVHFIVELARSERVDCVVIAGDVFDRAIPPIEALRLLNQAIADLAQAGITVIITAGNHDSGDRLATYSSVLQDGVHLVGSLESAGVPVALNDDFGQVLIYPLPYLEPDVARVAFAADDVPLERSHEAVMTAAIARIRADLAERGASASASAQRAVAVGHAFVAKVAQGVVEEVVVSESERDLTVGGVQVVPAHIFADAGLQYVALGHLHRGHEVTSEGPVIRYSGSLLRYSLSESDHVKSILLVDIGPPGTPVEVTEVPLPQPRAMSRLRGTMTELLSDAFIAERGHFVELIVTDDDGIPDRMHARLDAVFPFALRKQHIALNQVSTERSRGDSRGKEPLDVIADFFVKVTGQAPGADQIEVLRAGYEASRS
jgi:exonuclease SbcD